MFIIQILVAILIGYIVGYLYEYQKLKRKEREILNKNQMIKNRDEVINDLQKYKYAFRKIKCIFETEATIISKHDKVKELIDKYN